MKKFMAMLLTLVMALSLVACGQKADDTKKDDAAADTDDSLVVLENVVDWGETEPYRVLVQKGDPKGLLEGINKAIAELTANDGALIKEIEDKVASQDTYMPDAVSSDLAAETTDDTAASDKPVLVMGTSPDYPPYEFFADAAMTEYAGIDVEVAKYIAESMGMTLQIESMNFDNLVTSLSNGDFDVVLDEEGGLKRKADLFTKRTIRSHRPAERVDTAVEALALSIGEKARVDMVYMGQLTGKDEDTLFMDLQGVVFLNPDYEERGGEKYLPADEYLSGNVRRKLAEVRAKVETEPQYLPNVEALEKVQPVDLTASEISVRLGATWLDPGYIRQFIFETLDTSRRARWDIKVHYSRITGEWRIEGKSKDSYNVKAYSTYGTSRASAYDIIESSLNLKDVRIFDYQYDPDGRRVAVLNKKETAIAQSKQELLKEAFSEWIWKDPERREKICKA